jgi:hypothetical protein
MELIGRVMWWSERDENGIVIDPKGNEFYFDRSVLSLKPKQTIKMNLVVTFDYNESVKDCLCACNIRIPTANKKKNIERQYKQEVCF